MQVGGKCLQVNVGLLLQVAEQSHGGMISSLWWIWIGIMGRKGDILLMNFLFLCVGALDPWNSTL